MIKKKFVSLLKLLAKLNHACEYMFIRDSLLSVSSQVTIVVLGNKLDLQDQRRVDSEAAQQWARQEKVRLWEVSVTDRRTLIEPFVHLTSKMTQPQSKSTFPLSRNKNKGSGSQDS